MTATSGTKHSDRFGWCVFGIDANGKPDGIATSSEAEAVETWWRIVDTWHQGHVAIHAEARSLWLDNNTLAATMTRVDVGKAREFTS